MRVKKIPVKALKPGRFVYVLDYWRDGDYGHVRARIYDTRGSDWRCLCSFQWQYNAFQGQRCLGAYGCQLTFDLSWGPRVAELLPVIRRVVQNNHYGGFGLRYFLRRMRALKFQRWTFVRLDRQDGYTALDEPVPRRYRARAAEFLQAQRLVAV